LKGAEMPAIRYPGVSVNIKIDSSDYWLLNGKAPAFPLMTPGHPFKPFQTSYIFFFLQCILPKGDLQVCLVNWRYWWCPGGQQSPYPIPLTFLFMNTLAYLWLSFIKIEGESNNDTQCCAPSTIVSAYHFIQQPYEEVLIFSPF
jgi:hypothetical protein